MAPPEAFQHYPDLFLCTELAAGRSADLPDHITGWPQGLLSPDLFRLQEPETSVNRSGLISPDQLDCTLTSS